MLRAGFRPIQVLLASGMGTLEMQVNPGSGISRFDMSKGINGCVDEGGTHSRRISNHTKRKAFRDIDPSQLLQGRDYMRAAVQVGAFDPDHVRAGRE